MAFLKFEANGVCYSWKIGKSFAFLIRPQRLWFVLQFGQLLLIDVGPFIRGKDYPLGPRGGYVNRRVNFYWHLDRLKPAGYGYL